MGISIYNDCFPKLLKNRCNHVSFYQEASALTAGKCCTSRLQLLGTINLFANFDWISWNLLTMPFIRIVAMKNLKEIFSRKGINYSLRDTLTSQKYGKDLET